MTPEIRRILADLGQATAEELAERLKVQSFAGLKQLRDALGELTRRGAVVKEERPPVYRLRAAAPERGEKQRAIWRAAVVEQLGFTVKKLEFLAGAGHDYTRRYVQWLERQGFIVRSGVLGAREGCPRPEIVYRLAPGKERGQPPHWSRAKEAARGQEGKGSQVQLGNQGNQGNQEKRHSGLGN